MEFSPIEKIKLLEYVIKDIVQNYHISPQMAKGIVYSSDLINKIKSSPESIAHCSISQLAEMVWSTYEK